MVAGGNTTVTCEQCGKKFAAWTSAKRRYCSNRCASVDRGLTHGESRTRLYQIWIDMKNRCYCQSSPGYEYYGARGITVCGEWKTNYVAFRDWALANGYKPHLELDRRRGNEGYGPGNCRWATRSQQMRNTRKRRDAQTSKFKGVSRHSENRCWIAQIHEGGTTTYLGSFSSEIQAAFAYDEAAFSRYGEFVCVNFPERIPQLRERMVSHVSS